MKHAIVEQKLDELTQKILSSLPKGKQGQLAVIGIRSGGDLLARALHERLEKATKLKLPIGVLDITLYRDDLALKDGLKQPTIRATEVPFSLDGKQLILVDDVLFSGRTVRAALDALCDLGRPAKIELLVLIDRGFRELPIRPDYVGAFLETKPSDQVHVTFDEKRGWSVQIHHGT